MNWDRLDNLRTLIEQGDSAAAVSGLLDTVAELMEQVDVLNVQMDALLESLGEDEGDLYLDEDCSYIVPCPGCGCLLEVQAELLEEEDAELSCPECGCLLEL